MKAFFLSVMTFVTLGVTPGAFAQEFQVNSTTSTEAGSVPGSSFLFSERLDGSYTLPFVGGGGLDIRGHLQVGVPDGWAADLDALSVTMVFDQPAPDLKSLRWTLGRFSVSEPTGVILNHPGDGTQIDLDYGGLNLKVFAVYTGLINRSSSGTALSLSDVNAAEDLLASPRFIGAMEASFFPVAKHRLTLGALAQQDLNDRDDLVPEWSTLNTPDRGGAMDTQYLTVVVDGPVVPNLYYKTFGTFGTGTTLTWLEDASSPTGYLYEYKPVVSGLGGAELSYFARSVLSSSYRLRILYASGDGDAQSAVEGNTRGNSNLFTPVTGTSLGAVFSPALTNVLSYEVSGEWKPLPPVPVTVGAKVLGFQRALVGIVNAPGVQRLGPVWLGQELDVSARWTIVSDASLGFSGGVFLPTEGTYAPGTDGADLQFVANLTLSLSF